MSPAQIKLIGLALAIAGVFYSGWAVNGWRYEAKRAKALEELAEARQQFMTQQSMKAAELEKQLDAIRTNERRLQSELAQISNRPVYNNDCFDTDGLLLINAAAAGDTSTELSR